jgi:hypothetical protein
VKPEGSRAKGERKGKGGAEVEKRIGRDGGSRGMQGAAGKAQQHEYQLYIYQLYIYIS